MTQQLAPFGPTFLKDLIPVAGITSAFLVARASRLSLRDDVGLRAPPFGEASLWILLLTAWMLGSNYFLAWRGPWDFAAWRNAPFLVAALRVTGVVVLAAISEELILRGVFFHYLRTRIGAPLTIGILAAIWTLLHNLYLPNPIAVVFVAGLLLGAARWRTRSVYIPIAMHMAFNLYAIW